MQGPRPPPTSPPPSSPPPNPGPFASSFAPGPAVPYPYAYPAFVAPPRPGEKSFRGIQRLRRGTSLSIAFAAIAIPFTLLSFVILSSIDLASPGGIFRSFGLLLLVAAFSIVVFIVGLIAAIYGLLGLHSVHAGRREFGEEHARSVEHGTRLVIVAIVILFVGLLVGLLSGFIAGAAMTRKALITAQILDGGLQIVWVILLALGMQEILERLMPAAGRKRRATFLVLSAGASVFAAALGIIGILLLPERGLLEGEVSVVLAIPAFSGVITIAALWIYRQQLGEAEAGARAMIASGTLDPDAPIPPAILPQPVPAAPAPPA